MRSWMKNVFKYHGRYCLVFLLVLCAFFGLKRFSPSVTGALYRAEEISLLNFLAGTPVKQSLDYYRGRVEERISGPLESLIAGMLFLSFALRFLRRSRPAVFAAAVMAYLLLSRWEVLFDPPYGDALIGPFSDAVWLVRHHFDYRNYFHLASYALGGPQVYPASIFPSVLAVLMKCTPGPRAFLVAAHGLVFLAGAVSVTVFRGMLSEVFDRKAAAAGAVLVMALPLFQSMVELINMEMACLVFALLSARSLAGRDIGRASLWAVMSVLVKAPGVTACAAVFTTGMLFFFNERGGQRWRTLAWSLFPVIVAAAKACFRDASIPRQLPHNRIGWLEGWWFMKTMPVFWIFLALAAFVFWKKAREFREKRKEGKRLLEFLLDNLPLVAMFLMAAFWFSSYLNFSVMVPRYKWLQRPFFLFMVVYALRLATRSRRVFRQVIVAAAAVSFLNAYGMFYRMQSIPTAWFNHYERSLEYRNSLDLYRKTAAYIDRHYVHLLIGAPSVIAHALNFREVGYVENKLEVMTYGTLPTHEGMRAFTGLNDIPLERTIWVGYPENYINRHIDYPVDPRDKVLNTFEAGDRRLVIFRGGVGIERMRLIVEMMKKSAAAPSPRKH